MHIHDVIAKKQVVCAVSKDGKRGWGLSQGLVTGWSPLGCCVDTVYNRQPTISVKSEDKSMRNSATSILPAIVVTAAVQAVIICIRYHIIQSQKEQPAGSASLHSFMIRSRVATTAPELARTAPIANLVLMPRRRTSVRCRTIMHQALGCCLWAEPGLLHHIYDTGIIFFTQQQSLFAR